MENPSNNVQVEMLESGYLYRPFYAIHYARYNMITGTAKYPIFKVGDFYFNLN